MDKENGKRPKYKYICTLGRTPFFVIWRIKISKTNEIKIQAPSIYAIPLKIIYDPQHVHNIGPPASEYLIKAWYSLSWYDSAICD